MRRNSSFVFLALLLALTVACTNKKSVNPLANVGSKQPDKVLFDRAMDAMKHNRFDVSRMTLDHEWETVDGLQDMNVHIGTPEGRKEKGRCLTGDPRDAQ